MDVVAVAKEQAMQNYEGEEYETAWAIICHGGSVPGVAACGRVCLEHAMYVHQLAAADSFWYCPQCGGSATWDDNCPETFYGEGYGGME